jgi:hypothetical protein
MTDRLGAAREHRRECPPLGQRLGSQLGLKHLHIHVVCAGIAMRLHPSRNGSLVAPHDERIDHAIAQIAAEVVVGEANSSPVVGVVRQLGVAREVLSGDGACNLESFGLTPEPGLAPLPDP